MADSKAPLTLQERLASLTAQHADLVAKANMVAGAIQLVQQLIVEASPQSEETHSA